MRTAILAATALAASAAFSAPAFAQEETDFSGFRVGVNGGLDIVRPGSTEDSDVDGDDQSIEGALYSLEGGYDFDLGSAVVGVEGEIGDSTAKVTADTADPNFFGYGSVGAGRDLYLGGRVGLKAGPKTLVYAKGGYTNSQLNILASDGTTELDEKFRLSGWRLGAGVEQKVAGNVYAKVEYRYSNYGDADFEFDDGSTTSTFEVDTDRHQVVAGVGVRF